MNLTLQTGFYWIIGALLLAGCAKKENSSAALLDSAMGNATEDAQIQQYIKTHNIVAKKDASGLYYQVLNFGDSINYIKLASIPSVIYTRRLLNDTPIDASFGVTDFGGSPLKDHIIGWQIGLQKITKGGKVLLIIPSALAFGNVAVDRIPANSILVCEVELVDFR